MEYKVVDLYVGDDFYAKLENGDGTLFLHCDVYKSSSGTIKKIKRGLSYTIAELRAKGYDKPLFTYTQNPKFVKLIGGVFHNSFEAEGEYYEVFKWE